MRQVDREVDRYLTLIRNKIRQQGYTQLEVQEALGWGRSYISQLLTKQKKIRVEQVLLILNVIGVDSAVFYAELYTPPGPAYAPLRQVDPGPADEQQRQFRQLRAQLHGLVGLLVEKRVISGEELSP